MTEQELYCPKGHSVEKRYVPEGPNSSACNMYLCKQCDCYYFEHVIAACQPKNEIAITESKWCKCDEPLKEYCMIHDKAHISCWRCKNPWRKSKGIRGTELIDYPIGTEFLGNSRCLTKFMKVKVRLHRCPDDALIIQYYEDFWRSLPYVDYAFYMLQDRFEIVEEE